MADRPLLLGLYSVVLSVAGAPIARILLSRRERQGKEIAARVAERRGRPGHTRPEGPLVWLHAASVGEFTSVLPLIEALDARGFHLLVTTGTATSARLAATRLPSDVIHQFVPLDVPAYVRRFLRHWQPDLAILTESEIWPNMLMTLARSDVPVVIANARMSDRSFRRWSRSRRSIAALLRGVDLCLAQTESDAERLTALGAPNVRAAGNLKFDVPPPPAGDEDLSGLGKAFFGRRAFLAASTHPGESEMIVAMHARLRDDIRGLLTIIAPRHPDTAPAIREAAEARGLRVDRRSLRPVPGFNTEIFIVDTIGELGVFYRLAELAFIGGSLVEHGGHNPIEPAKTGTPILHGPHTANFAEIYDLLGQAGGAAAVEDSEALLEEAGRLMRDPAARDALRDAAEGVLRQHGGALQRTIDALEPYLMQLSLNRS